MADERRTNANVSNEPPGGGGGGGVREKGEGGAGTREGRERSAAIGIINDRNRTKMRTGRVRRRR